MARSLGLVAWPERRRRVGVADRAAFSAAVDGLAQEAARLAPEGERERQLPGELVRAMADAGVFRLLVPAAVGGIETHPATFVEAVETLARGDGAAGWCAAINATSGLLAGYLPEDSARENLRPAGDDQRRRLRTARPGGADRRGSGGSGAAPAASAGSAGYTVSGRWPFASGCTHCDWLMGGCLVDGDAIMMLAPADQVRIHDTWDSMGLRGSGSHDIEMQDLFVPEERSAALDHRDADRDRTALRVPAVRPARDRDRRGRPRDRPRRARRRDRARPGAQAHRQQPHHGRARHRPGGRRHARRRALRAARALLHEEIAHAWASATAHGEVPIDQRAALRLAATHAATVGAETTATAYRLAGGAAVYESRSPLPRRFRDAHTATQHMLVAPATNELAGRILLGLPTETNQL